MDKYICGALLVLWAMLLAKGMYVSAGLSLLAIVQTTRLIDIGEQK